MAAGDSTNPIPPFPADIDRFRFGDYLSGLVDGEGCFLLGLRNGNGRYHKTPQCMFTIQLRADDTAILALIQSFFGCGRLHRTPERANSGKHAPSKPKVAFRIGGAVNPLKVVVPQFVAHPLRAKKSRDFVLWEKAVLLVYRVSLRKIRARGRAPGGRHLGTYSKWQRAEVAEFLLLRDALRAARAYDAPAFDPPAQKSPTPEPPSLFDWSP